MKTLTIENPRIADASRSRISSTPSVDTSLNAVFTHEYCAMVRWCSRRVHRRVGDPEEFVHLAYIRCLKSWRIDKQSVGSGTAYLYRCLRWVVIDELRRFQRANARLTAGVQEPSTAAPSLPLRKLILKEEIEALPQRQQQLCRARLAGKSEREVRQALGVSRNAIGVGLCRAKAALTARFQSDK